MANGGVISAIRDAALEVERPIFFSLLIIISAYIPLFTLERVERKLFTPMAFTVCYALLGSMLLALTLIPVLATYLFRHGAKSWDNPVLPWLAAGTSARWMVLCASRWRYCRRCRGGRGDGAFALVGALGIEFLPSLDEGVIWIRANLSAGDLPGRIRSQMAGTDPEHRIAVSGGEDGVSRRPAATTRVQTLTVPIETNCSLR